MKCFRRFQEFIKKISVIPIIICAPAHPKYCTHICNWVAVNVLFYEIELSECIARWNLDGFPENIPFNLDLIKLFSQPFYLDKPVRCDLFSLAASTPSSSWPFHRLIFSILISSSLAARIVL